MRRPTCHRDDRGRLDVKMTPMIDVIFLLLIFFVCTASFDPRAREEILPTRLSLPGTIESDLPIDPEMLDLEEIVVKVLWRDGRARWQINNRDYDRLGEVRPVPQDWTEARAVRRLGGGIGIGGRGLGTGDFGLEVGA